MPRKSSKPLESVHIKLFQGDKETLGKFYPQAGYNAAVRQLVHNHCQKLRERESRDGVSTNVELPDPGSVLGLDAEHRDD